MMTQTDDPSLQSDHFFTQKPSWLIQKGSLTLHTHIAIGYGRKLLQMAERLRTLWQAAQDDNPYADHYLLRLEDAMLAVRAEFDAQEKLYHQQLVLYPNIQLELVTNQNPLIMRLYFLNIYSFRISILIGHFDRLARFALSLHHLAFANALSLSQTFQKLSAPLRKLFEILRQWQPFNVTRKDLLLNNENAKEAQLHFGMTLDPCILSGEIRPQFIKIKKSNAFNQAIEHQNTEN
jgi:integrating conjugative element protein (TIGR03761 family)